MPEETAPETTDVVEAPTYTFPFPIPEDLAGASDEDLRALHNQVREHAATFAGGAPFSADAIAALQACRDLAVQIADEVNGRASRASAADDLFAEIDVDLAEGGDDDDDDDSDGDGDAPVEPATDAAADDPEPAQPVAQTAASRRPTAPAVRNVAARRRGGGPTMPASQGQRGVYAAMHASADVPGFYSGQKLDTFADASRAIANRLEQYPALTASRAGGDRRAAARAANRRPITVYDPDDPGRTHELRSYTRHQVVQFRRDFPAELRVKDGETNGFAVAEYASQERRLPGGNLRKSAEMAVKAGRSLTAAAGWCAPSETIYDLMELETLDGLLDLPELQTTRGGWQIPVDGGPDFSVIYNSIGDAGDTHLSETDVINEVPKVCVEIPCPDFEEIRLGVDYLCITGGLLQRRGYPEMVARFGRGAVTALAHKVNNGVITALVAAAGAATVIPADPYGDDALSALMAAIDLAQVDMKYRFRASMNGTMEVVLPWWVLAQIRAAISRRRGVSPWEVDDGQILAEFTKRGVVPRFVYDWQDSFAGLATGPGGATALTQLPTTTEFLIYPAGTFVKAVQDVVALDTIYDSTLLTTNQYTALFTEDGWAVLQMGPLARRYLANVDPSGVTGCCDLVTVS